MSSSSNGCARSKKTPTELTEALNILKDYFKADPAAQAAGRHQPHPAGHGARTGRRSPAAHRTRIVLELDPGLPEPAARRRPDARSCC